VVAKGDVGMKRVFWWGSTVVVVLAFGLAGCGDGGDLAPGVPKDQEYVAPKAPPGSPEITVDMTKTGNRPKKAPKAAP
jgi:hypothetical protein